MNDDAHPTMAEASRWLVKQPRGVHIMVALLTDGGRACLMANGYTELQLRYMTAGTRLRHHLALHAHEGKTQLTEGP